MIPPDQAMELVSDDLRAKYFEETFRRNSVSQHRLSIDSNMSGGGGGNSSTGGSITDIHNNNNTTTSRDSSNTNSNRSSITSVRGKRNWAKLKLGWRDVVRSQFESSYLEWSNKSDRFDIWAFIADNYRKEEEAVMPGVQHQQQESSSSPASSTSSLPPPLIPTTVSTIGQPNITSSPPIVLINPALNRVSAASSINEEDLRSSVSSSSSSFSFITPPHGTIHVEELEEDENGELGVTSGGSSSPDDRFHTPAIL